MHWAAVPMLRSRAERPGWESLCASRCTPPVRVKPAPWLACVSSSSAGGECPWAPCRAGDPLQQLCHPAGCRAGREAFPAPWLRRGTSCSVDWLRTDKISGIFRSAGAGWGDPPPPPLCGSDFPAFAWRSKHGCGTPCPGGLRGQAAAPGDSCRTDRMDANVVGTLILRVSQNLEL